MDLTVEARQSDIVGKFTWENNEKNTRTPETTRSLQGSVQNEITLITSPGENHTRLETIEPAIVFRTRESCDDSFFM